MGSARGVLILVVLSAVLGSGCDASVNPTNSPGMVSQSSVATVPSASDTPTATLPTIAPPTVAAAPVPAAQSAIGLPNRRLTPGATNPAVTSATIGRTICVSGWSSRVRPPESYTEPLKIKQIVQYGYRDHQLGDYEEDHLIPISLGGALRDPHNLWPEPHHIKRADGLDVGSLAKDGLEDHLHAAVCAGRISLATAQHEFATNWVAAWIADGRP